MTLTEHLGACQDGLGACQELDISFTGDRAAVGSGHQKPHCRHCSPRAAATLLQCTVSSFSTKGPQKMTPAEMSDLAANQGRFSSAASGEAQGCDLPTWPTRCQAAPAPARPAVSEGYGVIAILQYSGRGFGIITLWVWWSGHTNTLRFGAVPVFTNKPFTCRWVSEPSPFTMQRYRAVGR